MKRGQFVLPSCSLSKPPVYFGSEWITLCWERKLKKQESRVVIYSREKYRFRGLFFFLPSFSLLISPSFHCLGSKHPNVLQLKKRTSSLPYCWQQQVSYNCQSLYSCQKNKLLQGKRKKKKGDLSKPNATGNPNAAEPNSRCTLKSIPSHLSKKKKIDSLIEYLKYNNCFGVRNSTLSGSYKSSNIFFSSSLSKLPAVFFESGS